MTATQPKPSAAPSTASKPAAQKASKTTPDNPTKPLTLPQEREGALDYVNPEPDPVIERAARDLAEGQVDTDLHATPGLDAERLRQHTPGARDKKPGPAR